MTLQDVAELAYPELLSMDALRPGDITEEGSHGEFTLFAVAVHDGDSPKSGHYFT